MQKNNLLSDQKAMISDLKNKSDLRKRNVFVHKVVQATNENDILNNNSVSEDNANGNLTLINYSRTDKMVLESTGSVSRLTY